MLSKSIFWFRRDLRVYDNRGLYECLFSSEQVVPIFIFDTDILKKFSKTDYRISYIYDCLFEINKFLNFVDSSLLVFYGNPEDILTKIVREHQAKAVFLNEDYEPQSIERDRRMKNRLLQEGVKCYPFKDHVIFSKNEILNQSGNPFKVFTPYKKKWLGYFNKNLILPFDSQSLSERFWKSNKHEFKDLESFGLTPNRIPLKPYSISLKLVENYKERRDFLDESTTSLSVYLRFGKVSIREIISKIVSIPNYLPLLSELIWREFFMQILFHYPDSWNNNFKSKYDRLKWRNNEEEFEKWCEGKTGYLIVDAGMRELNKTGLMANRVRMITASFLCKHLLVDWKWGESYFAQKLYDYEMSSNVGNWQWVAGTGVDATPYFRIFNPIMQAKKFDPDGLYIKKWVNDSHLFGYSEQMVNQKFARERCLKAYKSI